MSNIPRYPFLISRTLDPLFGIFVGSMAFYTYERREGRQDGHTLNELVARRWAAETGRWSEAKPAPTEPAK
ncbi:uncharacterized protein V1510DRAFT_412188 [Dipodascopsis tothii]|uniref:uncharacterized protein n=1 Tax=Dipodascopsis tothii TaxID=44089 RepID=UPI0034CE260E